MAGEASVASAPPLAIDAPTSSSDTRVIKPSSTDKLFVKDLQGITLEFKYDGLSSIDNIKSLVSSELKISFSSVVFEPYGKNQWLGTTDINNKNVHTLECCGICPGSTLRLQLFRMRGGNDDDDDYNASSDDENDDVPNDVNGK